MSLEKKRPRENGKCCEENCPYDWTYNSPHFFCDWHWQLWFNYGDETQALNDLKHKHRIHGIFGNQKEVL